MTLSQSQGQALTALLHTIRRDWGLAGITAALKKASLLGSAAEVAVAACRCAADPDMRTPALIADPGPHWQGLAAGSRLAPVMCNNHPDHKAGGCPECIAAAIERPAYVVVPQPDRSLKVWQAGRDGPWNKPEDGADLQQTRDRADAEAAS